MLMPRVASGVDEGVLRLSLEPRMRLFAAHYNKRHYIVPYGDDDYYYISSKLCIKKMYTFSCSSTILSKTYLFNVA